MTLFKSQLSGANHMHLRQYTYPKLYPSVDALVAEVTLTDSGIWVASNWLAKKLQEALALPYLPDEARDRFKEIGIKFVAIQAKGAQP